MPKPGGVPQKAGFIGVGFRVKGLLEFRWWLYKVLLVNEGLVGLYNG